jgi:hypothetical protein
MPSRRRCDYLRRTTPSGSRSRTSPSPHGAIQEEEVMAKKSVTWVFKGDRDLGKEFEVKGSDLVVRIESYDPDTKVVYISIKSRYVGARMMSLEISTREFEKHVNASDPKTQEWTPK